MCAGPLFADGRLLVECCVIRDHFGIPSTPEHYL